MLFFKSSLPILEARHVKCLLLEENDTYINILEEPIRKVPGAINLLEANLRNKTWH